MKKIVNLLFLISVFSYGQCPDYEKLRTGGTYIYAHNYIPFEVKHKDTIYKEDIFYPFDIINIEKYSTPILSKSKTYITNRGGDSFYKNIELESMEVNYPDYIKVEYENVDLYNIEKYDVKYLLNYNYRNGIVKYGFSLLLDKQGNILSENTFPDISKNSIFENYTSPCEALNLVRNDKRFLEKKIDYIKLAYVDKANAFCWLVKEQKYPTKLGINEYTLDSYFVNANSNKLEKVEVENVRGIACGIGSRNVEMEMKKK